MVGIGEDFAAAILTVAILKELGVAAIVARANSDRERLIMRLVGASRWYTQLPFILEAESTEILLIDPPESPTVVEAGADIAAALERHGANVTVHTEASGGLATDDVIRNRLAATGADLLVLGAYSHSWLRELLFGGVTRTVLQSMPVTAFLSR